MLEAVQFVQLGQREQDRTQVKLRRSYGLPSGAQETDGREWQEATHNMERSLHPSLGPPTPIESLEVAWIPWSSLVEKTTPL